MNDVDSAWAHWFVGLCDGEASFTYRNTKRPKMPARPRFKLTLQGDGELVREANETLFGGGYARIDEIVSSKRASGKAYKNRSDLDVTDKRRLRLLVDFFETFPLRSRKKDEFLLWRELVHFYCSPEQAPNPERIRTIVSLLIADRDSGMSKRGAERLLGRQPQD